MTLTPVVRNHHVEEAIRLFKFSTMDAVSAGSADGRSRGELNEEMTRIERELRRRLPVGWSTSYQSLIREFVTQQGYSSHALERTLFVLEKREVIRFSGQVHPLYCVHLFCPLFVQHFCSIEKSCASCRCLVLLSNCSLFFIAVHLHVFFLYFLIVVSQALGVKYFFQLFLTIRFHCCELIPNQNKSTNGLVLVI